LNGLAPGVVVLVLPCFPGLRLPLHGQLSVTCVLSFLVCPGPFPKVWPTFSRLRSPFFVGRKCFFYPPFSRNGHPARPSGERPKYKNRPGSCAGVDGQWFWCPFFRVVSSWCWSPSCSRVRIFFLFGHREHPEDVQPPLFLSNFF